MSDVADEISAVIHPAEETPVVQEGAPVPGRRPRGRPRKDPTSTQTSIKAGAKPSGELAMPPKGTLAKAVAEIYGFAGFGLMPFRPGTAQALMGCAKDCGEAWEALAEQNPQVRAMLLTLTKTSTYGVLVAAHAPIIMTAMAEQRERRAAKDADEISVGPDRPENPGRHAGSPESPVG